MDYSYCDKQCPIGIEARNKFLAKNDSVFDAAMDFYFFTEECFKTCPQKELHKVKQKTNNKEKY